MGIVHKNHMSFLALLLVANLYSSFGQETVTASSGDGPSATSVATTTPDPGKCAQDIIDWCKKQDFSMIGQSLTVTSVIDEGKVVYISCITNGVNGTECKKNNDPWYGCSTKNEPTFKGQPLSAGGSNDPAVCKASDQILRTMNQNKFNGEVFEHAMHNFNRQMEAFDRFMSNMFGPGFPFRNQYDDDGDDDGMRYHYNIGGRHTNNGEKHNGDDNEP